MFDRLLFSVQHCDRTCTSCVSVRSCDSVLTFVRVIAPPEFKYFYPKPSAEVLAKEEARKGRKKIEKAMVEKDSAKGRGAKGQSHTIKSCFVHVH